MGQGSCQRSSGRGQSDQCRSRRGSGSPSPARQGWSENIPLPDPGEIRMHLVCVGGESDLMVSREKWPAVRPRRDFTLFHELAPAPRGNCKLLGGKRMGGPDRLVLGQTRPLARPGCRRRLPVSSGCTLFIFDNLNGVATMQRRPSSTLSAMLIS